VTFSAPTTGNPPRTIPERILIYGPPKVGKSRAVLSVARRHADANSDARFHVINTEAGYLKMMAGEFGGLDNVTVYDVADWPELKAAAKTINDAKLRPHDWIVLDLASALWTMVQDYYVDQVFPDARIGDLGDLFALSRTDSSVELDGWKDWSVINKLYNSVMHRLIIRPPGHVIVVTGSKPLLETSKSGKVGESAEVKNTYGRVGSKPAGQKDLDYQLDSIIYMERTLSGKYLMTTTGDRDRERMEAVEVGDFGITYLMGYAGWQMGAG
jgi:hypothetical protein